ncbi:hypothetical protein C8R41DRAFT_918578 [Lentinula lateritia]|uniref:Uncharacterized protein n=1 Tax=Lentinula lateritia TaxID=40482 RepID=A0ABQ8VMS9_9AGAR|nr:hypothetical protein C8R41DRAFT_918578 [Lentinula lateritia]
MFARFRTVDVDDRVQLALLRKDSRRLHYICTVIGDSQSAFTDAFTSYPIHLRTFKIRGMHFVATKEQINKAIVAFSGTITTFIMHDSLRMSYQDFCGVLKSLVHCKMLRSLTLLSPAREYAHAAIQTMAYGDEEKAKPVFLQLIPSLYRHEPQYTSKASRPQEYE